MRTACYKYSPYLLLAGLALLVLAFPAKNPLSTEQSINLFASQFEFTPGRLEVNQGDTISISLQAKDVVHGLYLDGYDIETRVTPGVTQHIEFTADQVGKFRYRCSVTCGALHPFMIGELVVRPNSPLWKSILITLITLGGLLIFLWQATQERI